MGFKFLFQRVLLVFLLKELNHSSAFPRGRSSTPPESWQVERERQQDGYGYGNRRPLHYIRALRQANRTSSTSDQVQVVPLSDLEDSPLMLRSFAPTQNQLLPSHPSHLIQNPYQPWSGTKLVREMSPTLSALQKNHLLLKPRSFELNLKVPFANVPGQSKEEDTSIKGSGLSSSLKDDQQLYRPTSVQLYSSFNSPSGSDETGFTKTPNGGKNTHEVTKPSFQFSLSVPISPPSPSPKPSSDEFVQTPGAHGFVQNAYMEPNPHLNSVKGGSGWVPLNSGFVQQPTKHHAYELVTFPSGPASQLAFLNEPSSQSVQQTVQYPQQPEHIYSGYYGLQTQPTKNNHGNSQVIQTLSPDKTNVPQSPLQYESIPGGHYSTGQALSGNNYVQPQILQSVSPQLTSPPQTYDHGQFQASYGLRQTPQTTLHPSLGHPLSSVVDQPRYDVPSSGYYVRGAAAGGYYGKGHVEQTDSSYQHSSDHSGHELLHNDPAILDPASNYQSVSTGYQTQMGLPDQYNDREQLNGKPSYEKLLINMDDMTDDYGGQYSDFAAQTTTYYSGGNTAETHPNNPAYMPIYSQAPVVESGAAQYVSHAQSPMEMEQAPISNPPPARVNYAPAVGINAGNVQTNFGQQEPSFHPGQGAYHPSHGQYPTDQWQPQHPYQQSNHPVSDNGIQLSSHYPNPLPSVAPYQY